MAYDSSLATARLGQLAACAGGAFAYDDSHGSDAVTVAIPVVRPFWHYGVMLLGMVALVSIFFI